MDDEERISMKTYGMGMVNLPTLLRRQARFLSRDGALALYLAADTIEGLREKCAAKQEDR
jgi:hypothetical protein